MTFLASQFGEGIHARLLRSKAPTFGRALALETVLGIALYASCLAALSAGWRGELAGVGRHMHRRHLAEVA